MATQLSSITEQFHQLYQDHPQEKAGFTFRPSGVNNGLQSNPSGLSVSIVRRLSSYVSTKPPPTPPAGARGATCDLLDATFCNLDVDSVIPDSLLQKPSKSISREVVKGYSRKLYPTVCTRLQRGRAKGLSHFRRFESSTMCQPCTYVR